VFTRTRTPLAIACQERLPNMVRLLLDWKANVKIKNINNDDNAPLIIACSWSPHGGSAATAEIVQMLLGVDGIDVNIRNCGQVTPLHMASMKDSGVVPILLAAGANPTLVDEFGLTALSSMRSACAAPRFYENWSRQHQNKCLLQPLEMNHKESLSTNAPPKNAENFCFSAIMSMSSSAMGHWRFTFCHKVSRARHTIRENFHGARHPQSARHAIPGASFCCERSRLLPAKGWWWSSFDAPRVQGWCAIGIDPIYQGTKDQRGGDRCLHARDYDGFLPFHSLCTSRSANLKAVEYLAKAHPESVSARTNTGKVLLTLACESEAELHVVNFLMRRKPDVLIAMRVDGESVSSDPNPQKPLFASYIQS